MICFSYSAFSDAASKGVFIYHSI